MDDITLGGKIDTVAGDIAKIQTEGSALGLQLNTKKCELTQRSSTNLEPAFFDSVIMPTDKATLLGTSLTDGLALSEARLWTRDVMTLAEPSAGSACCQLTMCSLSSNRR